MPARLSVCYAMAGLPNKAPLKMLTPRPRSVTLTVRPRRADSRMESVKGLSLDYPKLVQESGDTKHGVRLFIPGFTFPGPGLALLDCRQGNGLQASVTPFESLASLDEVFAGFKRSPPAALGPQARQHDLSQMWMGSSEARRYPHKSRR